MIYNFSHSKTNSQLTQLSHKTNCNSINLILTFLLQTDVCPQVTSPTPVMCCLQTTAKITLLFCYLVLLLLESRPHVAQASPELAMQLRVLRTADPVFPSPNCQNYNCRLPHSNIKQFILFTRAEFCLCMYTACRGQRTAYRIGLYGFTQVSKLCSKCLSCSAILPAPMFSELGFPGRAMTLL